MLQDYIMNQNEEDKIEQKKILEAEAEKLNAISTDYIEMRKTSGWQRFEKELLDRSASLSKRFCTVDNEKELFRTQGEFLGLQSALQIIELAIEDSKLINEELKGE